ncbi:4-cresol dehydrogenase (hydroxylating) [Streptomyces sp. Ag82_O1-15]|nr:4-cresol dehydrogenase (hydroxylating) [Streptomyces sp. Ag82_O1-15]
MSGRPDVPFQPPSNTTVRPLCDAAANAFVAALGTDAVLTAPETVDDFRDPFSHPGWSDHTAAAVVMPATVEEVQAVVRIAGEHRVPLWTFSQGRNNAYGGPAPRVPGSVQVSLRRMNRVLEVNEELAYAVVEPGVRFFDLYDHLRAGGHKVWSSAPDLGWGSVIGNALDHGIGYTVDGDHAARLCGLEVVLPDGSLLRTGMGAMSGNRAWHAYPRGFGPTADGLFKQSGLSIVTRAGVWLMPEPECYLSGGVQVPRKEDLPVLIDALRPLLLDRTIQNHPAIGHPLFIASVMDGAPTRAEVYDGPGPVPEEAVLRLARQMGLGRWNMRFALYGTEGIVDARLARIRKALSVIPGVHVVGEKFAGHAVHDTARDQNAQVQAGIPSLDLMRALSWYSGEGGGHLDFSTVSPLRGEDVVRVHALLDDQLSGSGLDYDPAMILGQRHITNVAQLYFNPCDEKQTGDAYRLYPELVRALAGAGYGVYRTHVDFMDAVADTFDFGDHALRRFNERLKDALDPHGVLSPGKQGVWPSGLRHLRDVSPSR